MSLSFDLPKCGARLELMAVAMTYPGPKVETIVA